MKKKELFFIIAIASFVSFATTVYFQKNNLVAFPSPVKAIDSLSKSKISSVENIYDLQSKITKIAQKARKSVAFIKVTKFIKQRGNRFRYYGFNDDFFNRFFRGFGFPQQQRRAPSYSQKSMGIGTGFVIDDKKGFIVTNNHVVGDADDIEVTISGKKYKAKIIGTDAQTDIALIQIKHFKKGDLKQLKFADSSRIKPGQFAIAIGNPFGLSSTVTFGIVSAKGRSNVRVEKYENFIQTDAAINPGNSGGPLMDINGKVMGMNTAIYSKSGGYMGIGFAVPSNMIKNVVSQLKQGKQIQRAVMGVMIQELTPEIKKHLNIKENISGVLISSVGKNSPAQKAGIKEGDVITEFDGKTVSTVGELRNTVAFSPIDKKLPVKIIRNGKTMILIIKLISSNVFAFNNGSSFISKIFGFSIVKDKDKIQIDKVEESSPAQLAGLQKGDFILEINRQQVNNIKDFVNIIKHSNSILLLIERGGNKFYVAIDK